MTASGTPPPGTASRSTGPPPTTAGAAPRWTSYVALGDSFTEGLWDVVGGEVPVTAEAADPALPLRGWADRLAEHLARRHAAGSAEPFRYANLAVRGRLLRPIVREQVPAALDLRPDLVSIIGGGNDLLRPGTDVDAIAAELERAVVVLRRAGADVLLGTGWDSLGSPIVERTRGRTALLNAHVWSIARRHGTYVLDAWGMRALHDWRLWTGDRIHLTPEGHRRVADGAAVALGLEPQDPRWDAPLPARPRPSRAQVLADDAAWFRLHAWPWATRRLRRRSSGDLRRPKRPEWEDLEV